MQLRYILETSKKEKEMRHRHNHGCGPRRGFHIDLPEGLFAMRGGGRGFRFGPGGFDFNFGDDGDWGARRGRGRRRMFDPGELGLVLLKLIVDRPRHGYDLIRAIEEMTGGEYAPSPGVVYPTLTLLQDMGQIEEAELEAEGSRRPFQATESGRTAAEANADKIEELIERLEELKPTSAHHAGPAIGRAVKNLTYALKNRIAHDGWDENLLTEIVDILDEAAQRIERVKPAASDQ
jgi:DNA-binding PadR family transcriptional regulator